MPTITSLPDNVAIDVDAGETLLEAALRRGLPFNHACGGRAKCSTCRIWILDGLAAAPPRVDAEQAMADKLAFGDEIRLACQLRPESDLLVRRLVIDETDLVLANQLQRSSATRTGENRDVTIFFSDVANFTALSERMTPYDVMYLLNRYFVKAGEIVEANDGYIDKFVGDGLMAIFGLNDRPDAPLRAINAALETLAAVDRMKPFFSTMYGVNFNVRIGLHHGEAVIGSVGSIGHERMTAIGDVVNVASRVEAANKEAGTRLLITDALLEQVADQVEIADFIRVRLRGTSDRVTLHEVARLKPEAEAALNVRAPRDQTHFAGRDWVRLFPENELEVGERRIVQFEDCDVVVMRGPDTYHAFNNACPHLRLPFYERREIARDEELPIPSTSTITEDLGLVCRWHQSCFDLLTGEIRTWCEALNEDGTPPGMEHIGDVSKNKSTLVVYPCRVHDGDLWVSLD